MARSPKRTKRKGSAASNASPQGDAASAKRKQATKPRKKKGRPFGATIPFDRIKKPREAKGYCLLGLKDSDIAKQWGVSLSLFYRWVRENPELKTALKEGRIYADAVVATSAVRLTAGYTVPVKTEIFDAKGALKEMKIEHRYIPPSPFMVDRWLSNRQPNFWRPRRPTSILEEEQSAARRAAAEASIGSQAGGGGAQTIRLVIEGGLPKRSTALVAQPEARENETPIDETIIEGEIVSNDENETGGAQ
jgi:hypothetical protein